MPCFQVRTIGVDLNLADRTLLDAAQIIVSRQLYGQASIRPWYVRDGQVQSSRLTHSELELIAGQIKRAYAAEAVKLAAKRFGWTVTQTAPNKLTIGRRF